MASNFLTENEEHSIPSQILKTIFGLHASVIFYTQICVISCTFEGSFDPLWYETLVVNWQNWLFTLFHQSRSVLSPNLFGQYLGCRWPCSLRRQAIKRAILCLLNMYSTPQGRVTHICVSKLTITGSDNGLSPGRHQAIIGTNAGILLIGPFRTNWNLNRNSNIFVQENALENVVWKIAAILSQPQYVKVWDLCIRHYTCRPICSSININYMPNMNSFLQPRVAEPCHIRCLSKRATLFLQSTVGSPQDHHHPSYCGNHTRGEMSLHQKRNVLILTKFSSLAAPEVVIFTSSGAVSSSKWQYFRFIVNNLRHLRCLRRPALHRS